jgi:iron only hydrogenase large subunit-like protein
MEAAVRTAATLVGAQAPAGPLTEARGLDGFKRFTIDVGDITLKLGVVNGLGRLRPALAEAMDDMHFVEVMSCPGGCAGGGGQPYQGEMKDVRKRIDRIYDADLQAEASASHENKSVAALYEEYLGRPLGTVSHRLLHRTYTDRSAAASVDADQGRATDGTCTGPVAAAAAGAMTGSTHLRNA